MQTHRRTDKAKVILNFCKFSLRTRLQTVWSKTRAYSLTDPFYILPTQLLTSPLTGIYYNSYQGRPLDYNTTWTDSTYTKCCFRTSAGLWPLRILHPYTQKKRPLHRKGKELWNRSISSSQLGLTNLRVQQWKAEGVEEMQTDNIHMG